MMYISDNMTSKIELIGKIINKVVSICKKLIKNLHTMIISKQSYGFLWGVTGSKI